MTDKAITPISALTTVNENLPAHLKRREGGAIGLEAVREIVTPPYLKVVQAQSTDLVDAGFAVGDVALMPAGTRMPDSFTVTPLLVYTQYQIVNPREVKGLGMFREISLDPRSELAQRCRSMETFPCPENVKHECKCQSALVFLCWIYELEKVQATQPIASLMFKSSEYKTGKDWANKINLLGGGGLDVFAGRYHVETGDSENEKGRWKGFKPTVDKDPYANGEQYAMFEECHKRLASEKDHYVVVDDERNDAETGPDVVTNASF